MTNMFLSKKLNVILVLCIVGFSGTALADVWQDCGYLLVGAHDKNANGQVETGELVNQMKGATDTGSATIIGSGAMTYTNLDVATYSAYTQTVYGTKSNPEWGGWTATNRVCIYANQLGAGTCSLNSGYNPNVSNFTYICRVRRDAVNENVKYSFLMTTFPEKQTGTSGVGFQIGPGQSQKPVLENGKVIGNQIHLYFGHADVDFGAAAVFRNQRWVNFAVVVSNLVVTIGVKDETMKNIVWVSRDFSSNSYVTDFVKSSTPSENICLLGTKYQDTAANGSAFHGAMQFAAMWPRPLSRDEIAEAFSDRHPSVWRVGAEGKGAETFGGASGQGETELPLSVPDWSRLPSAFAAGDSVKIPFDVQYEEDGLAQYVRLKGRTGSGIFRVCVDGVSYGEELVSAGRFTHFFIPKNVLSKTRSHVCTITRTDAGATEVALDFYDMTGSFQVGLEDSSTNGTGGNGSENVTDYRVDNANLLSFKTQLVPYSTNTTGGAAITGLDRFAYLVDLPNDVLAYSRFTYTAKWFDPNNVVGQRLLLKVNDRKAYETIVQSGATTLTYKFRSDDLVPGVNRFEWSFPDRVPRYKADGTTKIDYYYRCDFQKFEVVPAKGLVLIVR